MKTSFAIFCSFINLPHLFGWKPYKGLILEFKEDPYNESIQFLEMLGEGSFADVWKGIEKSSRREVAVKLEKKTYYVKYSYQSFPEKKIASYYNSSNSFHLNKKITF